MPTCGCCIIIKQLLALAANLIVYFFIVVVVLCYLPPRIFMLALTSCTILYCAFGVCGYLVSGCQ